MAKTVTIPRNVRADVFLHLGINGRFYDVPVGVPVVVPDDVASHLAAIGVADPLPLAAGGEVVIPSFYGSRVPIGLNGLVKYLKTGVAFVATAQQIASLMDRGYCLIIGAGGQPARPPSFTRVPSIQTDGTPAVDEVALLDFGEATAPFIQMSIQKSGVPYADGSAGSYKWVVPGTYRLAVTASDMTTGLTATEYSSEVTVAAAATFALIKPILTRTAGVAAGTNPPDLTVSWDEGAVDRNIDTIQYQYTQTGTYSGNPTDFPLLSANLTDFVDEFKVVTGTDLTAGAFRSRARVKRKNTDNSFSFSDWSTEYVDTLGAPSLPVATSIWGTAQELVSGGARVYTDDGSTARLGEFRSNLSANFISGRIAYAEVGVILEAGSTLEGYIGLADKRALPGRVYNNNGDNFGTTLNTGYTGSGAVGYDGPRHPATLVPIVSGDKIGILIEPIMSGATQTGSKITFYRNGVLYTSFNTTMIELYISAAASGGFYARFTFNAGQTPFVTANMQQYQWG